MKKVTPGEGGGHLLFFLVILVWEECLAWSPEVAVTTHPSGAAWGTLAISGIQEPWIRSHLSPLGF